MLSGRTLWARPRLKAGLVFILGVLLTCAGCWDARETDQLAIVGSIGLDRISERKVLLSLEVISGEALARGIGQVAAPSRLTSWVLREEAMTVSNALANIQRRLPREVFLGQVATLVLGMNLAREGVAREVDALDRQPDIRRSIFLVTCDSASGLLQRPFIEELPSTTLRGLILQAAQTGKTTPVTLNEFLTKLAEPGIEPITMHTAGRKTLDVEVFRQGEDVSKTAPPDKREQPLYGEIEIPGELPPGSPVLDPLREYGTAKELDPITLATGLAAYRGDKLVGFLEGNDARGYLWVVGRVRGGAMEVPNPVSASGPIGVSIVRASSRMTVQTGVLPPVLLVRVSVDVQAIEVPLDVALSRREIVDLVEKSVSSLVKMEIDTALRLVREELRTDIYGFGQAIFRKDPHLWRTLESDWNDRGLQELRIQVTVNTRLKSPGTVLRSSEP